MGELLQFGEENDVISEKMHRLGGGHDLSRNFPGGDSYTELPFA